MEKFYSPLIRFATTFGIVLCLVTSVFAQITDQTGYHEGFSGETFPAGWESYGYNGTKKYGRTTWQWNVVQGPNSRGGFGSAMNIKNDVMDLKVNSIWAYTKGITLEPGVVYSISFYHQDNGEGGASMNLIIDEDQDFSQYIYIKQGIQFGGRNTYERYEYSFTVSKKGTYYIGFGVTDLAKSLNAFIDDVEISTTKHFYNKLSEVNSLNKLTSWSAAKDGSGPSPFNFTDPNRTYHLINYEPNKTYKAPDSWQLSGAGSTLIVGDSLNKITLEIAKENTLTQPTINLAANATLQLTKIDICPKFGKLSPLSTVYFGKEAPADINQETEFGTVIFDIKSSGAKNRFLKPVKIRGKVQVLTGAKFALVDKFDLYDNDLELQTGATIEDGSANRYVVLNGKGRVRKALNKGESISLPVGHRTKAGTTVYSPVKIKLDTTSIADVFSVGVLEGVYNTYSYNDEPTTTSTPITSKGVNKTWVVSEDAKGGSNVTLTFTWAAEDMQSDFDPKNCHIKHFENGFWDSDLNGVAKDTIITVDGVSKTYYTMSRSGIKSFSPFTTSSDSPTPLPVDLVAFFAKANRNNAVELSWATASEQDNDYFSVERSTDGRAFTEIGQVKGAGTSSIRREYTFTDHNPLSGPVYYRLRQVDYDGKFEYSPVRSVALKSTSALALSIYPNPVQGGSVNLQVQGLTQGEEAQVVLSDMVGRRVLTQQLRTGIATTLSTHGMKGGTYLLSVITKNGAQTQKLVVQ